tara:strand:- start:2292 stop:2495 length:204 start_codon:yes stop_codon:yes gene_type:complete
MPGKKRKVEHGSWGFGIDGENVEVEGKMITRRSGKKIFRADEREDRQMFREIKRNESKLHRNNRKNK